VTDDTDLVCVYRAGDMAAAAFLRRLLEEASIPTVELEAGIDGFPTIYFGPQAYRIMIRRADAEAHSEEIAEIIRQFEETMGYGPHNQAPAQGDLNPGPHDEGCSPKRLDHGRS
jgi:hypothetical protein